MTKIWAYVVSRSSCGIVGRELALGARLAEGTNAPGAHELESLARNRNVAAKLVEAALGALYLQYGFERIRGPLVGVFVERIEYALTSHVDHKTELQEVLAQLSRKVVYTVLAVEGPAHDRRFRCAALIDDEQYGIGSGSSKKAAEQAAARQALERLASEQ